MRIGNQRPDSIGVRPIKIDLQQMIPRHCRKQRFTKIATEQAPADFLCQGPVP
jgi:hypothetical protein